MAGAPRKREVQRVTIEIKGGPKKEEWNAFKKDIAKALKNYKSVKAKITEIAYVRKKLTKD